MDSDPCVLVSDPAPLVKGTSHYFFVLIGTLEIINLERIKTRTHYYCYVNEFNEHLFVIHIIIITRMANVMAFSFVFLFVFLRMFYPSF